METHLIHISFFQLSKDLFHNEIDIRLKIEDKTTDNMAIWTEVDDPEKKGHTWV